MAILGIFKFIFYFLFFCFLGGVFFYTILDLKPWRKEVRTKIWRWMKNKKKKLIDKNI